MAHHAIHRYSFGGTKDTGSNSTNNQQPVEQKFSFSISNIEGPPGAFECIQQSHSQMNILGALQYKMRIQAKDDVYDATRESMAKAAETQKNKCTREIKPNQTDIGRKIKIKTSGPQPSFNRTTPNSLPASVKSNNRLPSASSSSLYSSGATSYKGPLNSHKNTSNHNDDDDEERGGVGSRMDHDSHLTSNSQSSASSLMQSLMSLPTNYDDHDSSSSNLNHNPNHLSNSNSNRGGGGNLHHRNSDIMKRSIKERLIHLLALRPFKKPELYKRVIDEGIKERDKNVLMNVLKTISFMRDNAFILHRYIWNDVHEDWPFYTEQDRQTLKRRKPQNLTPPLSSDGGGSSSTSGQSPNSQHNGSPPPAVKRPSSSNSSLNNNAGNLINGERVTYMEPNSKKPRISHYRKDTGEIVTVSNHGSRGAMYEGSRGSVGTGSINNNNNSSRGSRVVDQDDYYGSNVTPNAQESEDSGMSLSYTVLATDVAKRITPTASTPPNTTTNNNSSQATNLNSSASQNGSSGSGAASTHSDNGSSRNTSSNSHGNSYNDNNADMEGFRESAAPKNAAKHFSDYPRITSVEQRRKYKTEFDNDYAEYRQLHAIMEKVSRRFAQLEEELRNEEHNDRKYKEIQKQILKEYKENSSNSSFQDKKKRFQYLHQKLSHIKRLVSEFDSTITNGANVINSCAPASTTPQPQQRTQTNY